eukprot:1515321-Heterocapsa_arctica.AAC.1
MGIVGPAVEPQLTPRQASIRGGSCGPNITRAYEHLAGAGPRGLGSIGPLWADVLGEAASAVEAFCASLSNDAVDRCPAVVLADQSKAFERMGLAWLRLVLDAWDFPAWVRESLLALVSGRGVRACIAGGMGAIRAIRRGLGMGGPAS